MTDTFRCLELRSAARPASHFRPGLACAAAVLLSLLLAASALAQDKAKDKDAPGRPQSITVVLDDNYPPYIFRNDDGLLQGILVDQWRAWERATGVHAELVAMDWERAQQYMREGRADVIDTIFQNAERAKIYAFGKPYATLEVPVFFHKTLSGIKDISSLRGFTIGVKAGDAVIGELKKSGINSLKEYASYRDIIEAARNNDIRVFSIDMPPALYYLYKYNMDSDFRQSFVLYTGQFHRAVRKGDEGLLRLVEEGFAAVPDSTYKVIEQRWLGAPIASRETLRVVLSALLGIGVLALVLAAFIFVLRRRVRARTSEIKVMLEELRESEERFRTIFNSVSDLIFIHSWPDGSIVDVNQRACEAFGYTREGILRLPVGDLSANTAPFKQVDAMELMRKAHEGEPQVAEWLAKRRDGSLFWIEVSIRRALVQGRERILVSCRDISERKAAEVALHKSEAFNRKIIDASPDSIKVLDKDHRLVFMNRGGMELLGLRDQQDFIGHDFLELWLAQDRDALLAALEEARQGRVGRFVGQRPSAGGHLRWWDVLIAVMEEGPDQRFLIISRDITERKEAAEALTRERLFTDAVIDSVPGLLYLYDDQGRLLRWNRMHEELTGYSGEELSRMRLLDWYKDDPATILKIEKAIERVMATGAGSEEAELQTKSGKKIPFYFTAVRLELDGKAYFTGIGIDITERRRTGQLLADKEALLQAMLRNLPFDFWARDTGQRVIMQSEESLRLWGDLSPILAAGTGADKQYQEQWNATNRRVLEGEVVRSDVEYVVATGERRLYHAIVAPILDRGRVLGIMGINVDVTERTRAEAALRENRRVLQSILNTVPQSIFWKDTNSVYLGCNEAFARGMGLSSPRDVVGRTDFDLPVLPEAAKAFRADDREVMVTRTAKLNYLESLMRSDGHGIWLETSKLPLLDDSGQAVGVMGVFEDVTARKEAEEQLVQSKRAADAASLSKSEFLANMSHEIRTPLNGVLGMVQLLKTTSLAPDQRDYVSKADEAARRLLTLLNDILDFSKIEAGRMTLARNAFGLEEVFETVSNVLGGLAFKKGLSLSLHIDPSVPPALLGDDARIRQILFNLAGNAVKFTRQGSVRVEAWRLPGSARTGQVRLCLLVSDTGVGIPDDKIRYVFERFTQSDGSYARQYEGAGLGLAIVKRIVDLMGGTIAVDSEVGRGTSIYLTLDLELGTAPVARPRPAAVREDSPPLNILLADDEPIGQMAMRVLLERMGHSVTTVGNGLEVLAALRARDFDCVLLDIQMPEMDGAEATRIIRSSTDLGPRSRVPIIALTAYAMEGDREKFLAVGMDGHVGKPVQAEDLARALAKLPGMRAGGK